jgi:restriction system protein
MSQPKTVDRGVSFIKFVLGLLRAHPDGMRPRDIYAEIQSKLPLDDFDKETMKGSGLPRWRATLHFHSVAATKAVLLVKSDGRWRVTDEGQKFVTLPDYELKRLMRSRYREWRWSHQKVKTARIATAVDETPPLDTSVLFEDAKENATKSTPISIHSRATNSRTSWRRCLKGWDTPRARFQNQARMEGRISLPISIRWARRRRISGFR